MNFQSLKKVPIIAYIVAGILITNIMTYYVCKKVIEQKNSATYLAQANTSNYGSSCSYDIKRLQGFEFIKPLLFVDNRCESDRLMALKVSLSNIIQADKNLGKVNNVSIYLKDFSNNDWMAINNEEKYSPGSLFKVPVLIAYLKMEEDNPGILNQKLTFNQVIETRIKANFISKSIVLGHSYTIKELLNYMIIHSDNNATSLLNSNVDLKVLTQVFTDFGLAAPNFSGENPITVKDYTYFMRTLYNASYLNLKNSEYATELLSKCNFKEGLVSGIPASVKVAHKFGESGNQTEQQLHEAGIVFLKNKPYAVTIMTKGSDLKKLPEVVKEISSAIYQFMVNANTTSSI